MNGSSLTHALNTEMEDMNIDDNRQTLNLNVSLNRSLDTTFPVFPYFDDALNDNNCIEHIALTDEFDDENASIFSFADLSDEETSDNDTSNEAVDEVSHNISTNTSLQSPVSSDDNPSNEALNEVSHDINANTSLLTPVSSIKPITFVVINNSQQILSVINKVQFVQVNTSLSQHVLNNCTTVKTSASVEPKRKRGRPSKNRTSDEALESRREVNRRAARNYRQKQGIYKSRSEKMLEAAEELNVSLHSTIKRAKDLRKQLCELMNLTKQQLKSFVK